MLHRAIALAAIAVGISTTAPAQERFKPGETFHDCADCPEMVVIPAGSFTMGSPASEVGRYRHEGPQRGTGGGRRQCTEHLKGTDL